MSDELLPLQVALSALLQHISSPRRRWLAQQIGRELAKSQRQRISTQQNPDGTPYAPRKTSGIKKRKIRKNKLFQKIKLARYLKTKSSEQGVEIGYSGNTAHIASIHQFGRIGKVDKAGKIKVQYAKRQLLGFAKDDLEMIEKKVLASLAGAK